MTTKILIISLTILSSCLNRTIPKKKINVKKIEIVQNETISSRLQSLIKKNAEDYIREMRSEFDDPIYVNVLLKKLAPNSFEFSIYVFDILLEGDKIPYDFSLYQFKGKNVIYYYSDINYFFDKEFNKKQLIKNNLIKDNNIVLNTKNNRLNDFMSWHCFICENDLNKIIIIKSPYVLANDEKPKDICL